MTCIVGLVDKGRVYMGGDSAGVGGYEVTIRADQKVWRAGDWVMGFTTSFRMGQLLRYAFVPPPIDGDLYGYMVTHFVDGVRECLKKGGYAKRDSEVESGGSFLVGVGGRLFAIHSDYQVEEGRDGYLAIGCGASVALGALYATADKQPEVRLRLALEAAAHLNIGVRGPFVTEMIS